MKIAMVHDWLTGMRGGEKCLEVLCRRFPDAQLYTLLRVPGATSPAIERMRIATSFLQRLPGAVRHYRYTLPLMPRAIERFEIAADVDLLVSFSHAVAKGIRPPPGVPHICYCFTPMRYAWHRRADYFAVSGRVRNGPIAAARNLVLDRIRDWDRKTSDRVSHFVAISRTVARRIAECYGRTSRVIYPGVDTRFYTPADRGKGTGPCFWPAIGEPNDLDSPKNGPVPECEDYYVCVSALVPYKRIDLAIAACNRLGRRLVVIGDGPQRQQLARLAGPQVLMAGWRSDEEIRRHLRRARALLFPGHEDFGIVPLEAQACGTPVIAFGQGGATETVLPASASQSGTGLWFAEQTVASLCDAICELESHPEWFDLELARQQAERFSLERFEREIIDYVEEVGERKAGPHPLIPSP
jgi:glycosyltransferase involved in cell wall biosynthesis